MYDAGEYEDKYGLGRMDWTLDENLEYVTLPFFIPSTLNNTPVVHSLASSDQWDANRRSPSPHALEREIVRIVLSLALHSPLTAFTRNSGRISHSVV